MLLCHCSSFSEVYESSIEMQPKNEKKKSNKIYQFISLGDNDVSLTEFEASPSGMIKSFTTRFPSEDSVLEELWRAEMPYHKL